ncbi:MAG: 3-hydroxyacyl-CoA dehydrogenase NAD-binding domain-containing protein [Halodesulfurarchaeum sp.]
MEFEDVSRIGVMGAGTMGHGIAEIAALAGYEVHLRDIERDLVEAGYDQIEWSLEKLVDGGHVSSGDMRTALDGIDLYVDLETAVAEVDVVIEAVPEREDIKRDLFESLEETAPERAIFTTNTSSLSVSDIAAVTDRPGQFCGMHFFNPPVRMDLVEVVRGAETSARTIGLVESLAEDFGKTPVRVRKDTPGFVVNRVLIPMLNEAAWTVFHDEETMDTVDSTAKYELGLPMGAFELADLIGIDVVLDILEYMEAVLGSAYTPCPLLYDVAEAGTYGKKSGSGFYDYDDGGVEIPKTAGSGELADRLRAVMANEVAKLVEADVVDPPDIDLAMGLGAGFPRGPATMADERGIGTLYSILLERMDSTGADRYEPADLLASLGEPGETFSD